MLGVRWGCAHTEGPAGVVRVGPSSTMAGLQRQRRGCSWGPSCTQFVFLLGQVQRRAEHEARSARAGRGKILGEALSAVCGWQAAEGAACWCAAVRDATCTTLTIGARRACPSGML